MGGSYIHEPAIEVTHADGNPSLQLIYSNYTVDNKNNDTATTNIILQDAVYSFQLTLHFKSYSKENVIEAWTTIQHEEKSAVTLQHYASSNIRLNEVNIILRIFLVTGQLKCTMKKRYYLKDFITFNRN